MPRIDPQKLLTCLSVLLAPNGGIRSSEEVKRLAGLMDKFSKKLVSKCIYIQICKSTETELLGQFMAAGGWSLTHNWLSEGIQTQNWPLVRELLELLLLCPVDVARLKSNSAPKLVKQLSKEGSQENVRILATKLVEQWLKIVKGETMTNTSLDIKPNHSITPISESGEPNHNNNPDGPEQAFILSKLSKNSELTVSSNKNNPITNDSIVENGDIRLSDNPSSMVDKQNDENNEKNSLDIKDNIKNDLRSSSKEKDKSNSDKDRRKDRDRSKEKSNSSRHDRDRKDDRKKSSSSSSSSSKSKSSSSSHKSSSNNHKSGSNASSSSRSSSSSRNKERDRSKTSSSSSRSGSLSSSNVSKEKVQAAIKEKEKSREITETKGEQEDKDNETLAKLLPPSIDKLGKIPKKPKEPANTGASASVTIELPVKKTPSISIEVRKDVENRPKTVKTFNSQFRSHGLAEEAPPPPSRKGLKKPTSTGSSSFSIPNVPPPVSQPIKRPSPPPGIKEPIPEKKLKIDIPIVVEKQIGIKLIPPKPKPVTLIESDMFMDAISASVPPLKKESKKRKRRTSASKEGGQTNSPPESPTTPISPAPAKSTTAAAAAPALKFYQDTLDDVDESKKAKKDNAVEESKSDEKDKEENVDKTNKDDDVVMVEEKQDRVEDKEGTNAEGETLELNDKKDGEEENAVKTPGPGCGPDGPPGVLVIHRRNGPKKQLKWRPPESLEEIRFFELDETERVNVTKTFIDAKQMERCQEREFVQTVRNKFQGIDKMFEEMEWINPMEVEGVPPHPAGSQSKEKRIQIDRELTVLKVLYFSRHTIPDSPAEPDMEYYNSTDPVTIPLNDITGNPDTVKSLTNLGWPEPKLSASSAMGMGMNITHSFGGGPPFMQVDMPRPGAWPINQNTGIMRMPGPFNNSNDFSPPINSPPFGGGGGGGGMNQNFGMNMMPNMMNMGMNSIKDNLPMRMQPNNNNNNGNWFRPNGPSNWLNNKNNRDRDEGGRGGRGGGGYNGGRNDRGRNRGNSRYGGGYKSGTKNY